MSNQTPTIFKSPSVLQNKIILYLNSEKLPVSISLRFTSVSHSLKVTDISLNNESDRSLVIIQKFNFHHLVFQLLKGVGAVGVIDSEILSVPFLYSLASPFFFLIECMSCGRY